MKRLILLLGLMLSLAYGQEEGNILLTIHGEQATECLRNLRKGGQYCPISNMRYSHQGENGPLGCDYHTVVSYGADGAEAEEELWAVLTKDGWYFLAPLWEDEIEVVSRMLKPIPVVPSEVWTATADGTEILQNKRCDIHTSRLDQDLRGKKCDPLRSYCVWEEQTRTWRYHCTRCSSRMRACGPPPPMGYCNHRRRHELLEVVYECVDPFAGVPCNSQHPKRVLRQRYVSTRTDCDGNRCRGKVWIPCVP